MKYIKNLGLIFYSLLYAYAFAYTEDKNVFYIPAGLFLVIMYMAYTLDFREKPKFNREDDLIAGAWFIFYCFMSYYFLWINNADGQIFSIIHNTLVVILLIVFFLSFFFPNRLEKEEERND